MCDCCFCVLCWQLFKTSAAYVSNFIRHPERTMEIFDSGNTDRSSLEEIFENVFKFLREEAIERTGCTLAELTQVQSFSKSIGSCSKQTNGTDCGVFTCVNMFCEVFGLSKTLMSQDISDHCRKKIGLSILRNNIC